MTIAIHPLTERSNSAQYLGPGDAALFHRVAEGVFDHAIEPGRLAAYLATAGHYYNLPAQALYAWRNLPVEPFVMYVFKLS